jgi:hypothetical protein
LGIEGECLGGDIDEEVIGWVVEEECKRQLRVTVTGEGEARIYFHCYLPTCAVDVKNDWSLLPMVLGQTATMRHC